MRRQELVPQLKKNPLISLQMLRLIEADFLPVNLKHWVKKGYLKPITRGRYLRSDVNHDEQMSYLISNTIYRPSYISMESALRYYDLIPEGVFMTTACSSKKTQDLAGAAGFFRYYHLKPTLFRGYQVIQRGSIRFSLASPAKTICDFFYLKPHVKASDFEELRRDLDLLGELTNPEELFKTAQAFGQKRLLTTVQDFIFFWKQSGL